MTDTQQQPIFDIHPEQRLTFQIVSVKGSERFIGSAFGAVCRAQEYDAEMQPAWGTQIELNGETVWDSEEEKYA